MTHLQNMAFLFSCTLHALGWDFEFSLMCLQHGSILVSLSLLLLPACLPIWKTSYPGLFFLSCLLCTTHCSLPYLKSKDNNLLHVFDLPVFWTDIVAFAFFFWLPIQDGTRIVCRGRQTETSPPRGLPFSLDMASLPSPAHELLPRQKHTHLPIFCVVIWLDWI